MEYKIIPNPFEEEYNKISAIVEQNGGYCPCVQEKNSDTKCICKTFKEQQREGMCHCGRFKKIVATENTFGNDENEALFAKLRDSAKLPTRRDEDGCYDLYADISEPITIAPHTVALVPTGIISAFSDKYRVSFRERGSNTKSLLQVMAGQLDSGYRGEWLVAVYNANDCDVVLTNEVVEVGNQGGLRVCVPCSKAICQFAFEEVPQVRIRETTVERVRAVSSERGEGRLGSSGK